MRIESSVTSISWIPSEAVPGVMKLPFEAGPLHYDDPPGDRLPDLSALAINRNIRFANELRAFIDVEDGRIVRHGHLGRGWMGVTHVGFAGRGVRFPAVALPDIQPEPSVTEGAVRFHQTTGGKPALPLPRRVNRPPFVQITPPVVWTTLALTLHADGRVEPDVIGASPFPRHWIYD